MAAFIKREDGFFSGDSAVSTEYIYKGRQWQGRSFRNKYKGLENHPDVKQTKGTAKHRYLMPLDDEMREQITPLTKPYPKRSPRAKEQDAGHHPALGGVTPTRTLQILEAA